jgi:hypothetical protein
MITKKCKICETEFEAKNEKGTFCSDKCRAQSFRNNEKKKMNDFLKSKKDNLIIEQINELQILKRIVNDKDITINNFQIEYNNLYKNHILTSTNLNVANSALKFENELLVQQKEEVEIKLSRYKREIIKLRKTKTTKELI